MTGWHIAKRTLLLIVTALSLYLLAPKVISVLASWPQLKTLKPGWLALALLFEAMSYLSLWSMQRVALHATSWFAIGTAQLASGAVCPRSPIGSSRSGCRCPRAAWHMRCLRGATGRCPTRARPRERCRNDAALARRRDRVSVHEEAQQGLSGSNLPRLLELDPAELGAHDDGRVSDRHVPFRLQHTHCRQGVLRSMAVLEDDCDKGGCLRHRVRASAGVSLGGRGRGGAAGCLPPPWGGRSHPPRRAACRGDA
jgi:hypothetical protein